MCASKKDFPWEEADLTLEKDSSTIVNKLMTFTGWWFGAFGLFFPIILGMSSSQLTNSDFSGGWLNHQPVKIN